MSATIYWRTGLLFVVTGRGGIIEKPRVITGQIKVIAVMTLTLVFDHRVVDGAKAAQFLREIKILLENPYRLFTELL